MPRLNTNCVICDDTFMSSDVIQSTYCGHIFHKNCLDKWKTWKLNCPICQREFPKETFEHQLFLELEDDVENSPNNDNIQANNAEVKTTKARDLWLQEQMREMKLNFLRLQEEFTASEKTKKEFEQKIKNLEQLIPESNQLLGIESKDEKTREIEDFKNIALNTEEKSQSLETDDYDNIVATANELIRRNQISEEKLNELTEKLEKEMALNTKLKIEKLKADGNKYIETDNYLLLENIPKTKIIHPLENIVIYVGAKLDLDVSAEDILKVRVLEKDECANPEEHNVSLLVEFKSNYIKVQFLLNKKYQQNYLSLSYNITTLGDNLYHTLIYTNEKLKNCGGFTSFELFGNLLYPNDCYIFAIEKENQRFKIANRQGVDILLKRYLNEKALSACIAKKGLRNPEVNQN